MKNSLDAYFDAGWREFVKENRRAADYSNQRMFRILRAIKGPEFVKQLIAFKAKVKAKHAMILLTKKPLGEQISDRRFSEIPEIWIKQGQNELGKYADISIQIRPDRWIKFVA
jgi:hypothetical protein